MNNRRDDKKNNQNKQGWGIVTIATILAALLFLGLYSMLQGASIKEITYDKFLKMVDEGKVEKVTIGSSKIYITSKTDEKEDDDPLSGILPSSTSMSPTLKAWASTRLPPAIRTLTSAISTARLPHPPAIPVLLPTAHPLRAN